jgi:hypothetical protein
MSHRNSHYTGGGGRLSAQQSALYHDAASWLTEERKRLGTNSFIELADAVPTLDGINCSLQGVVRSDDQLATLFSKGYGTGCGRVYGNRDDATGTNIWRVDLVYQEHPPMGGAGAGLVQSGGPGGSGILDSPRALIIGIVVTSVSAAFTTSAGQWTNLAHVLFELCRALATASSN